MSKNEKITALNTEITVMSQNEDNDYISMTDIANFKNADYPSEVI